MTTATEVNAALQAFEVARKRARELRIDAQRARAKHAGAVRINAGSRDERVTLGHAAAAAESAATEAEAAAAAAESAWRELDRALRQPPFLDGAA